MLFRLTTRTSPAMCPPPGRRPALQAVPALHAWWRTAECAKKTNGSELRSLPASSGESVKGGILPFHKSTMTNRNSPPRAEARKGVSIAGAKRRAVREGGLSPLPAMCPPPGPGSPVGDRRAVPALHAWWRTAECEKNKWQRTLFAARDFGGKCERGILPFHKSTMTNRNSPPRAEGAQGSFDCRREAPGGWGALPLDHRTNPAMCPPPGPLDPDRRSGPALPVRPAQRRRNSATRDAGRRPAA